MKVLVLSITTGQGHNATAKALCSCLESMGVSSQLLDTYGYLNKILGKTVSRGYLITSSNAKLAYSGVYRLAEKRNKNANKFSATRITNMMFTKKMKRYIDSYGPDVIMCTHIFAGIIIDILKQSNNIKAKTIGIVTDFTFHPYWEESIHFDYIVTANELLNIQAYKKGFINTQILPTGIPINPKFNNRMPKDKAREKIGIDTDKLTILLMSGSMGYGHIEDTLNALEKIDLDFQIIIVCGNNLEVKERIDSISTEKNILNLGYVDYVDVLMDASDCIITKPGGLTTSEALAKDLPLIIVNPIPGQEDRNTEFLLNNGVAMASSPTCPVDEIIFQLFSNPKRLEVMKDSISLIKKPDSTRKICEFVKALENGDCYDVK